MYIRSTMLPESAIHTQSTGGVVRASVAVWLGEHLDDGSEGEFDEETRPERPEKRDRLKEGNDSRDGTKSVSGPCFGESLCRRHHVRTNCDLSVRD